jgi:hypothetical protein
MRGRAIGLGLLGLGAFALVAALMVWLFLAPTMVRLPLDQKADVTVTDQNATYLDRKVLEETQGPVTAHLKVEGDPAAGDASDDVAVWHSGTTITDGEGELITEPSEIVNCLDRRTAEAVACDEASGDIEGLTLTFPFDTQKRDYEVWNGNAGEAVTARYTGEDEVNGVSVHQFEQSVPETVIDQIEVPGSLAGSDSAGMVTADVVYSSERVILVEPTSGKIVSSVEHPVTVLQGPDGSRGITVLDATLGPDEAALETAAQEAGDTRDEIRLISAVLPWSLAGLGVVLLLVGLALFLRSRARGAHRPQPSDTSSVPVSAAS